MPIEAKFSCQVCGEEFKTTYLHHVPKTGPKYCSECRHTKQGGFRSDTQFISGKKRRKTPPASPK